MQRSFYHLDVFDETELSQHAVFMFFIQEDNKAQPACQCIRKEFKFNK